MPFLTPLHPPISTLLALDRVANTLLWSKYDEFRPGGGWGDPNETMSARSGA